MTYHARNIKDLSIALEALTRVPGSDIHRYQVEKLLETEIQLMKETHPSIKPTQPNRTEPDDEIPF